jgi:hypothetical protein
MEKRFFPLLLAAFGLILMLNTCSAENCAPTKLYYTCNLSYQESTCASDGAQYYRRELDYSNISGTCCKVIDDYRICYYETKGPEGIRAMIDQKIEEEERKIVEWLLYEMCGGPLMILPIAMMTAGLYIFKPARKNMV